MKAKNIKGSEPLDISSINKDTMLEELVETLGSRILKLAFTYVKDQKTAEDLTQEVFLKCYKNWDHFRGESSVKTWVYTITINLCKDYLRSWSFRNLLYIDFPSKQKNVEDSVLDRILERSHKKELAAAVLSLPVKYREAIILHYYESYRVDEIASFLHVNENTVRTRLRRAKDMLQKKLRKETRDENGR